MVAFFFVLMTGPRVHQTTSVRNELALWKMWCAEKILFGILIVTFMSSNNALGGHPHPTVIVD